MCGERKLGCRPTIAPSEVPVSPAQSLMCCYYACESLLATVHRVGLQNVAATASVAYFTLLLCNLTQFFTVPFLLSKQTMSSRVLKQEYATVVMDQCAAR